jgi:hypothetical protein
MPATHGKPHFTCIGRPSLLYMAVLATLSHAQDATMGTSPSPISFITSVVTSLSSSSTLVLSSSTTLATSIVAHRTTLSTMGSPSSHTPLDPILAVSHPTGDRSDDDEDGSVFNYYFLFLAVLGVLIGLLLWWLHWRRHGCGEADRMLWRGTSRDGLVPVASITEATDVTRYRMCGGKRAWTKTEKLHHHISRRVISPWIRLRDKHTLRLPL